MYESEGEGRRNKDRPCTRSLLRIVKPCIASLLKLRNAKVMYIDRDQRRDVVYDTNSGVNVYGQIKPSNQSNERVDSNVAQVSLQEVWMKPNR